MIKEKLKRSFGEIKKRAQALKLKHDIKNVQTSMEGQWETLGKMVVTHRPATVDIGGEIAELTRIHNELAQKQATIASLRQTKGSTTVINGLEREIAEKHNRQREIMIDIGKKAEAVRANVPDAGGNYSALECLHATFATKQAELTAIEEQIGPVWEKADMPRLDTFKKPSLIAGGVILGCILLYLLWIIAAFLFGGGGKLPKWAIYYVPGDAQGVAYANIDGFRKTDLYQAMEKHLPSKKTMKEGLGLNLTLEDIRDFFFTFSDDRSAVVVLRTYEDAPLDEILLINRNNSPGKKSHGIEYVRISDGFLAKTASYTYCVTPTEDAMKAVLGRLDRREQPKLDKGLKQAIAYVAGNDYYLASSLGSASNLFRRSRAYPVPAFNPNAMPDFFSEVEYSAVGALIGGSLRITGFLVFEKERAAERCVKSMTESLKHLDDSLSDEPEEIKQISELITKPLSFYSSGKFVYLSGKWKITDVEQAIEDLDKARAKDRKSLE